MAALPALAVLVLVAAGCSAGGTGTRDEGPAAGTQPAARPIPSPVPADGTARPAERVDAVALLKRDPQVSAGVRAGLKPCAGDAYPVDTSYGSLTGGSAPDVVANVMTCGDALGIGTYVYRRTAGGTYEHVFGVELPATYGTIDRGDLVVTTRVYGSEDAVAYPSGEDVVTYRWTDGRFREADRVHNEFNRAVGSADEEPEPARTTKG
ncbi:hypothetical protein [uncultured Streptomyces sp.]|uniref:hypothetical protein n=1 Tax=uncultured Streptomyces sp. TaxID=174707 RepID=UPI002633ED30|nr:hypothetical protein [uncultured Streptomyces sp.]